ncbi:AAA family ATPase [Paenibacillus sp. 5J-6]|uniref:AAA family ATPase n=1 Tax=Paenibacillus silvestris TaxID=2606219 RepID=A0A6L8V6X5_9BACL|nr:LuxR C-terminal-related transcriptional regulator [Paenibacillus silvestris]MZQ85099.1 AAA family ATPase [Paenibacillus silvestris]
MSTTLISTKMHIPLPRPKMVVRTRLTERLSEGLHRKLTLLSASSGFGKTLLVSEWLASCKRPAAWVSIDESDNDPARFLAYLSAALRSIGANIGEAFLEGLQAPYPPPIESILTVLLNEISSAAHPFILVLDDFHRIDADPIHQALSFLLEHLPPQMHLVITTREDPPLPLARLRARGQLTELRAADLRLTLSEAADFLNQTMGLNLSTDNVSLLEARTEGWVAGLQLAAISMEGLHDATGFIKSFSGSHRFVLDYLVEEVLHKQSTSIQTFLLHTSILDRFCAPLCDAVMRGTSSSSSHEILKKLEQANLFLIPLDNERRWFRYHHLFSDLLRKQLQQSHILASASSGEDALGELHLRASRWYEENGLELEAFHHAAAAKQVDRAARLLQGNGIPLHFRGMMAPVLQWLASLRATVLEAKPSLLVMYASALVFSGQNNSVEQKLLTAEKALKNSEADDTARDLAGQIAFIRAMLAIPQYQSDVILAQSLRALEYLHPDNLSVRAAATWTLGFAYQLQGDRSSASQSYREVISFGQSTPSIMITIAATTGLGSIQEADSQLVLAAESYEQVIQLAGEPALPAACEAHLGLARISYEWNELKAAERHAQQSLQLARQIASVDTYALCELFFTRLKLAQGDAAGAAAHLAKADQFIREHNFVSRMPDIAAAQVLMLLQQGNLEAAAQLAHSQELAISQARVHLTQGDAPAALAVLEQLRQRTELSSSSDERLKAMALQVAALHANGDKPEAAALLVEVLKLAEPGGYIRLFVDLGIPIAELLSDVQPHEIMPDYLSKLLASSETGDQFDADNSDLPPAPAPAPASIAQNLIEPLSVRELKVLELIALGLSNREISEQLFVALSTVKGHNQRIFDKLQVKRRTEAIAKARELGLM